jgi:hypothetical protein
MFPVLSILRRGAHSVVYVEAGQLAEKAGARVLHRPKEVRPFTYLNLKTCTWEDSRDVPFTVFTSMGKDERASVRALTHIEDGIATKAGLLNHQYTLFAGHETCEVVGGKCSRSFPMAIVRGVYTLVDGRVSSVKSKPAFRTVGKKLPPGTTTDF